MEKSFSSIHYNIIAHMCTEIYICQTIVFRIQHLETKHHIVSLRGAAVLAAANPMTRLHRGHSDGD